MGVSWLTAKGEKNLIPAHERPREGKRRMVLHWQQLFAAACCQCSSAWAVMSFQHIDMHCFLKSATVACILLFVL